MTKGHDRCVIVLDLRCLQDPDYARRGVGRHALSILRQAPRGWRIDGLTDPSLPALLPEVRESVNVVHANPYAASGAGTPVSPPACFVMMSPMTHDPLFPARLLSDPRVLRAAVVHDFIPHRSPDRYLTSQVQRLGYALALRWMARCQLFLSNSRSSADDLASLLKVPESAIAVTGCPLDPALESMLTEANSFSARHVLVVGGGDPRKNPEVVIRAHARSGAMQNGAGIPLVIAGNYSEGDARAFRAIAAVAGGRADLVEAPGHLTDLQLVELYRQALVLVCPSQDEGFSIPVIEGMAAGVPCLVSDIPAHAELITDSDCHFPANNEADLQPKLDRVVADVGWRAAILRRQADVWPSFRASAVADRFWGAVTRRLEISAPTISRGYRPRVAILSPLPPDRSGVADYSAATCAELGQLVELHVFTETARPGALRNVAAVHALGELPHLSAGFDRVISVVGNSHFHARIFELMLRYGGACIAHDARMLGFYRIVLGLERALAVAAKELGRPVTEAELNVWLGDEGKLEALFLGEIAENAAPTIVHSPVTASILRERFGVAPAYLPFSIYRPWQPEELTQERRAAARARLELQPDDVAIVTFGFVDPNKAPEECVWALELLRSWGIPASLHFAGAFDPSGPAARLRPMVANLGLEQHVRLGEAYISDQTYRDYLVGSDLAVQLRTYALGGLSGALLDCAAAGLPTVTNESLGEAVGIPDYIRCIPDALSPQLLAEALANLLASGLAATRPEAARRAFSAQRSLGVYARKLCQALSLEMASQRR